MIFADDLGYGDLGVYGHPSRSAALPLDHGFDSYFGIPYSNEETVRFIREHRDESSFLYLARSLPRVPLFRGEAFAGVSARGLYGDVVEEIDWSVGELLETLTEEGLSEQFDVAAAHPDVVADLLAEVERHRAGLALRADQLAARDPAYAR
jgi:arylsulfatase A-like enzyme